MLWEHTMTANFSYRAIPNLTLVLNGGHFFKMAARIYVFFLSQFLIDFEKKIGV